MEYKHLILVLFFITSCKTNSDKEIELCLKLAETNKNSLEEVLKNYSNEFEKRIASEFLIKNIIGKSVLDSNSISNSQTYFDALIDYHKKQGTYQNEIQKYICDSVEMCNPQIRQVPRYLTDIKNISADYLTKHIEHSFYIREKYNWSKKIDFDIFCKYILPYTTNNCYWTEANTFFYEKYKGAADTATSLTSVANLISTDIDNTFSQSWVLFTQEHPNLLPTTFKNLALAQIGTCLEQNTYKIAALRAMGVPAVLNTIPVWGNSAHPHFWTEIIDTNEKRRLYKNNEIPFTTEKEVLINGIFWGAKYLPTYEGIPSYISVRQTRTIPKVYRVNYELQRNSLSLQAKEDIPGFFKNPGLEDITDQYIETVDINIPVWKNKRISKYVYLCCYNTNDWSAVDWATVKRGQASFKNVGVNVLYMPAYYQGGAFIPAGNPFILERNGHRKELCKTSQTSEKKVVLYTKYPYRANVMGDAMTMVGGRFQLANNANFSDTITVYSIKQTPFYEESFEINKTMKSRYLICNFNNTNPFYVAEIEAFGKNEMGNEVQLTGKLFGNAGKARATIQNTADHDRVSFFAYSSTFPEQYIAFDFGKPVQISRVKFYPRSDDNRIVSDELYELFYWNENGWVSLGKQIRENNSLIFSNIPENVLLRIHNHTRGVEHRPFTYENEKQIWW